MKEALYWVASVLEQLKEQFPNEKAKPNITLPREEDADKAVLVFAFMYNGEWNGFGITEDDLKMTPDNLVSQVRKDLGI